MLEIKNLMVFYENALAVNNINMRVRKGKVTGVFGANSAGKSTLMYTISGIIQDLLHPRLVAPASERSGYPGAQDLFRLSLGQEPGAERKHIRIIMFPAVSSGSLIIAQGRADARHLIGRDGGADARAIDDNAAGSRAGGHQLSHLEGQVGVVGRLLIVHADIPHFQAEALEDRPERFFQEVAAVVGAHGDGLLRRGQCGELVFRQLHNPHAARLRHFPGRRRHQGPDGNPKLAGGRHVLCGDYAFHVIRQHTGDEGGALGARRHLLS